MRSEYSDHATWACRRITQWMNHVCQFHDCETTTVQVTFSVVAVWFESLPSSFSNWLSGSPAAESWFVKAVCSSDYFLQAKFIHSLYWFAHNQRVYRSQQGQKFEKKQTGNTFNILTVSGSRSHSTLVFGEYWFPTTSVIIYLHVQAVLQANTLIHMYFPPGSHSSISKSSLNQIIIIHYHKCYITHCDYTLPSLFKPV